jgi:hypothetical protein
VHAAKFRELADRLRDPTRKAQAIDLAERCDALARSIDDSLAKPPAAAPRHPSTS